jgi:hypothetical protein
LLRISFGAHSGSMGSTVINSNGPTGIIPSNA